MGILHPGITQSELVLRTDLNRKLTISEMDGNFVYLEDLVLGVSQSISNGGGGTGSGEPGTSGTSGISGIGVPAGGDAGYILAKASSSDYDTVWIQNVGGGGTGSGTSGINGSSGTSGINGVAGSSGTSGVSGGGMELENSIFELSSFPFGSLDVEKLQFGQVFLDADNESYLLELPWDIEFLGQTYNELWINSNSYVTFGASSSAANAIAPGIVSVPAIFLAAGNNSLQNYLFGFDDDAQEILRIRFEGSNDDSGFPFPNTILWEMILDSNSPDTIKVVFGTNLRNPGGVYGISDGTRWIEKFSAIPTYDEKTNTTLNAIDIYSLPSSDAVEKIKFIGPGVYRDLSDAGTKATINIDPLGQYGFGVNYDQSGSGTSVLSANRFEMRLTTGDDGSAIRLRPRGDVYLQPYNRNGNQFGEGYNVRLVASNASPDADGNGDYDGGSIYIVPGNKAGAGSDGNVNIGKPTSYVNINAGLSLTNQAIQIETWAGPEILFSKPDYGTQSDLIGPSVSITRADNRGIYNPELEPGWDNTGGDPDGQKSPKNTLWNTEGWSDLTNLGSRTYVPFYTSVGGNIGNGVLAPSFIMKDVVNDKYYKIDFTVWGNSNNGAPVTYTRQEVDGSTGEDIGSPVTFEKPGYADPFLVYDEVGPGLKISRGSNQAIFNVELETGWNGNWPGDGNGMNSPEGTIWNLEGWSNLHNVKSRKYRPLYEALDGNIGSKIVGKEFVMKDIINDEYWAIKFSSWTINNNGGGFSYTRRLINKDAMFVHTENGGEIDQIAEGIGITRDYGGAIYNPYDEGEWDDTYSPGGTLWNFDGYGDLSNLFSRDFKTFFSAQNYWGIGDRIEGSEAIMFVPSTNEYYAVKFIDWQRGGGGGFSYIRTLIDTEKINEGIRFADGTVQKTSADTSVRFRGPFERRIEVWHGYKEISITQSTSITLDSTVRYTVNQQSNINVSLESQLLYDQIADETVRNISVSLDGGMTWNPVRYSGGGNWGGIYVSLDSVDQGRMFTATASSAIKMKYWRGGEPQVWFDPDDSPGGQGNFRGAVIDYHAYSRQDGTIVGQIITSVDNQEHNVTHTESASGGNGLANISLWKSFWSQNDYREGRLAAFRVDGESDIIKIQWKATMFYGSEFYD